MRKMTFDFRRTFNPTPEEQEEDRRRMDEITLEEIEKRSCGVCAHYYDNSVSLSFDYGCKLGHDDTAILNKNRGKCEWWQLKEAFKHYTREATE